jgi:hypothetical protein
MSGHGWTFFRSGSSPPADRSPLQRDAVPQECAHAVKSGRNHPLLTRHGAAAVRVRISNPDFLFELLAFLQERPDTVVAKVNEDELEVSLLDSRRPEALRRELERRLRGWQETHPELQVQVLG